MSHDCHQGSCSHKGHSNSSHSHSTSCCTCCRCPDDCSCKSSYHSHKYSDELLALADEAWMELIKEKIKEEIKKHSNKHITQIAELVAKTNHARWTYKLEEKSNHDMYEEDLTKLIFRKK